MGDQKGQEQSSPWKYDVFLSFRSDDTPRNFVDHLYLALCQVGINTFRADDEQLTEGEHVSYKVMNAIIFIIIFSKNYASSRRCLHELLYILELKKKFKRLVLPIFYDVRPSDVRNQSGIFAEAFARHERYSQSEQNIQHWRDALNEVGNLSGWDLRHVAEGSESEYIHIITEEILQEVRSRTPLYVTKHPVALFSRVKQMEGLLYRGELDDVRVVGIYGMSGIGKTTLAKAVFNQVFQHFEASCFLENVRSEASERHNGLVHLQEQLLRTVLRKKVKVYNVDEGITLIKERLWSKKFLIVLDDLDDQSQLNALLGEHDWLHPGSRVVITTRDKHLLNIIRTDDQYEAMKLDHKSSLQLFTVHACRKALPPEHYVELIESIITYCGGVPLSLEVLGAYLSDKRIEEWKSAMEKLKTTPPSDIHKKLKISFDGLPDDYTKAVFLDIACFFFKILKSQAISIFAACGFYPEVEICELIDKSLLTIDQTKQYLSMHDLIRDMGREIVSGESPDKPGKCSRLWCPKDIFDVLIGHEGTKAVEGIVLESSALKDVPLSTRAFEKMVKLRLLKINYVQLYGSFQYLPKSLKCFQWHYCPSKCLPSDFCRENLVILDMSFSNFDEFQAPLKYFNLLKRLIFYSCQDLKKSPEFVGLHNLEELSFGSCLNLTGLDSTIGDLKRLRVLNVSDCKNIWKLPSRICDLKSLEILYINGCTKLKELPDNMGNLEGLRAVHAVATAITRVPSSFGHLKNLEMLLLSQDFQFKRQFKFSDIFSTWLQPKRSLSRVGYLPPSFSSLCALKVLQIENCNLTEEDIPFSLASLSSLQSLCFRKNKFQAIPFSLRDLSSLKFLNLNDCPNLRSIPEIPHNLQKLSAYKCKSLETLPNLSDLKRLEDLELCHCEMLTEIQGLENLDSVRYVNLWSCKTFGRILDVSRLSHLRSLDLGHCQSLIEIRGLENLHSIRYINLFNCKALKNPFTEDVLKAHYEHGGELDIGLCSSVIPHWFSYQVDGCSMCFNMPQQVESKFLGMFLWVVYGTVDETTKVYPKLTLVNQTNGVKFNHNLWTTISFVENSSIYYIQPDYFKCPVKGREKMSIHIECSEFPSEDFVKKCGVHLLYKRKDDQVHSLAVSSPCFDSENEMTINHSFRDSEWNLIQHS